MKNNTNQSRRAFTLVELLVVIAIIGVLVSLLLPAVQAAREAARMVQCRNNLKQLALSLHNYHDAHKTFPPSVQFDYGDNPAQSDRHRPNWLVMVMPFIELQNLYDQIDFAQPLSHNNNAAVRGTRIAGYVCPTDEGQETPFQGHVGGQDGSNWARGSYGGNASQSQLGWYGWGFVCHCGSGSESPAKAPAWADLRFRGVMGACVALPIKKITDGTSHTMLLGELRIGINEFDHRGTWAMGNAGASALFAHGSLGDANGPNNCAGGSDDTRACNYLRTVKPGSDVLEKECMACYPADGDGQTSVRSRHQGGVFVALADGSVLFVSDLVDSGGSYGNYGLFDPLGPPFRFSPWDRLISCCDNETLRHEDLEP